MIDYSQISTETIVSHEWSGKRTPLIEALNAGEEIIGFAGAFECPESRLSKLVPEGLPFSRQPVMIEETYPVIAINEETGEEEETTAVRMVQSVSEEGELIYEQKTWGEYAIVSESITEGEYLLTAVDYVSESKCHSGSISSENLHIWANDVGASNVRMKSEFKELRKPAKEDA